MTDVLLVYPKTGWDIRKVSVSLPLACLSVASTLVKSGYDVKILDQRIEDDWQKTLSNELKKEPICVGVSSITGTQIHFALEISRFVKNNSFSPVVWGGVHPTLLPIQTMENEFVDIVVKGEGEITLLELVQKLDSKSKICDVSGIAYKDSKKIINNPDREYVDLNTLPELPYTLLDIKKYPSFGESLPSNAKSVFPFISSRGCPYACTFCCNPIYSQRRWRAMNAETAIKHIDNIVDKFNIDGIVFHDENFFVDKKRVEKIAKYMDHKLDWGTQARIDVAKNFDILDLHNKGLCLMGIGIESGSDRILSLIRKGVTVSDIIKYNKLLSNVDIVTQYNFMVGFPTESIGEIYATIDLAMRLITDNDNAEITGIYVYAPYPGTELFDISVRHGFNPPKFLEDWAKYSRQHSDTPWLSDKKEVVENIALMSKFVDGKRLKRIFKRLDFLPLSYINALLGNVYKKRWKKHDLRDKIDLKFMKNVLKDFL